MIIRSGITPEWFRKLWDAQYEREDTMRATNQVDADARAAWEHCRKLHRVLTRKRWVRRWTGDAVIILVAAIAISAVCILALEAMDRTTLEDRAVAELSERIQTATMEFRDRTGQWPNTVSVHPDHPLARREGWKLQGMTIRVSELVDPEKVYLTREEVTP